MFPLIAKYDNRAEDLTKEGMLKGIERAAAFVLFLSAGVLQRPYCQMEIREAAALKKPIVLVHGEMHSSLAGSFDESLPRAEADVRYRAFDFRAAHAKAPIDLQELLDNHESLVSLPFSASVSVSV